MKAVRHLKRVTARFGMNFLGASNGLRQATREIMQRYLEDAGSRRCPPEALNLIRSAYSTSAETFGNGVLILTKATTVELVAIGECCAAVPGPRLIVSKCNPLTAMSLIAMSAT